MKFYYPVYQDDILSKKKWGNEKWYCASHSCYNVYIVAPLYIKNYLIFTLLKIF